ncbi:hypothetical protein D3C75_1250240 [compost metagenome]
MQVKAKQAEDFCCAPGIAKGIGKQQALQQGNQRGKQRKDPAEQSPPVDKTADQHELQLPGQ